MKLLLTLLLVLASWPAWALAQDDDAQIKTETLLIYSKLLGDEKVARLLVDDLAKMADEYGLNFKALASATTKALNQGVKPAQIVGLLTVSIDTAVGVRTEDVERARTFLTMAEALGEMLQMKDSEDLYAALSAVDVVGVPLWAILADSIGISERETKQLALRRGFKPRETAELIMLACQKRYGGLAKKLAESRRK